MLIWTARARSLMIMSERDARGPEDHNRASHADGDAVFDFGDSGRPPGGAFGLLPLGPRPDRALQDHLAAVGFDGDAVGIELRVAAKGILDLAPDLGGSHAGLEDNQVADALDAFDPQHRVLGAGALVVPLGASFERQPAVLGDHLYVRGGVRELRLEGGYRVAGDFRIRPFGARRKADRDVVGDADDAGDALHIRFGLVLLGVAAHEAGQSDDATLHGDGNVSRIDVRIPSQLRFDVTLDVTIRLHLFLPCWSG